MYRSETLDLDCKTVFRLQEGRDSTVGKGVALENRAKGGSLQADIQCLLTGMREHLMLLSPRD